MPEDFSDKSAYASWKPSQQLQAQADKFAEQFPSESDERSFILSHLRELASLQSLEDRSSSVSDEVKTFVDTHKDAYVQFLRQEGQEVRSFIEQNKQYYADHFQKSVADLKESISHQANGDMAPGYLGRGLSGSVYQIEVDDEQFAVKLYQDASGTNTGIEVQTHIRAWGIPHTSELVAYSNTDAVAIQKLLPGQDLRKLSDTPPLRYSSAQLETFIDTIIALFNRGLTIDPKPDNILFDPEQGFSILDYQLAERSYSQPLEQQLWSIAANDLMCFKDPPVDWKSIDREVQLHNSFLTSQRAKLPSLLTFLTTLQNHAPDQYKALKKWDENMRNPESGGHGLMNRSNLIEDDPQSAAIIEQIKDLGF